MIDISIIIVNWNSQKFLEQCINSIQCNPVDRNIEIIVIDNASSEDDLSNIQKAYSNVRIINNQENIGFARANNEAAKFATGEYLLFLNPDTIVHPEAINTLIKYLEANPHVAAVGPRLINADGTLQISSSRAPTLRREIWRLLKLDGFIPVSQYPISLFSNGKPASVDVLLGACILLRADISQKIGLFDEDYFVYSEEVDLCERIRHNGWELHWIPGAAVTHFGGISTRQVSKQMFIELYRNKVKFFRKNRGVVQAGIYKSILFIASLMRVISCWGLYHFSRKNREQLISISDNYQTLIRLLPAL